MAKLTYKSWKEERRFRAMELLKSGWKQKQVADAYGVTQGTISQWKTSYEKHGEEGLLIKSPPGTSSSLTDIQKQTLCDCLDEGAEAHGFQGNFWTQKRVSRLILEQFSIELQPRTCGDLIKVLGYTLKIPQLKSYDQNPQKVKEWKEEKIPEIKKSPRA